MATTTNLGITKLELSTAQPETVLNTALDILDAQAGANAALLFQRRNSTTTGLTWGYHGGTLLVDGVLSTIAGATVALTASATNFVQATRAGVVSTNTTGFTAGQIPLYEVVTGTATITSFTDRRSWDQVQHTAGRLVRSITSDANIVLTAAEARNTILEFTSTVSLTVTRNVQVPLAAQVWTVYNNTTGGQALQFIGPTGTGVPVQQGRRTSIYSDGTNVVAASSYTLTQVVAFAASLTIDANQGGRVIVGALTANITINAPTNPSKGQILDLVFLQDATGGRTFTWNGVFRKAADGAGTANQKGAVAFMYDGTDWIQTGGALVFF